MSIIEPVYIYDVASGDAVSANLHHSISAANLLDWRNHWKPACDDAFRTCFLANEKHRIPGSWHWEWDNKIARMGGLLAVKGYSIVCEGMTQGLMSVITAAFGRHPEHIGKPIVYIDFIESAPWNIKEFIPPGRYKGIGDVLVQAAVNLSYDEGYKGRIGLHSLSKAEGFYSNHCGMTDLGIDIKKEGLRYFEMTTSQSLEFAK